MSAIYVGIHSHFGHLTEELSTLHRRLQYMYFNDSTFFVCPCIILISAFENCAGNFANYIANAMSDSVLDSHAIFDSRISIEMRCKALIIIRPAS